MRRALLALAIVAGLLVVAIIAIPLLFKDRLVALLRDTLSQELGADVGLADVSLDLWSSFPNLRMVVDGLSVTNRAPFEGVKLADVARAELVIDLASVWGGGEVELRELRLEKPVFTVLVDEQGRANYEVGGAEEAAPAEPAAPAEEESAFALNLRSYAIRDFALNYKDAAGGTELIIEDLDHEGTASLGELIKLSTRTDIAALTLHDSGVDLLRRVKVGADLALEYESASGAVTIGENRVQLGGLPLAFKGRYAPVDGGADVDVSFQALETTFASLLSLVPTAYKGDLSSVAAAGTLALQGSMKGLLPDQGDELPAMDLALQVEGARFQYPDLPSAVEDIALDLKVHHPGGLPDNAEIDLNRFHFVLAGLPLDGRLRLRHPESDPDVDLELKGDVDLAKLASAIPMDGVSYTGRLNMDLNAAGRVSAFEAQQLDAVRAGGTFLLTDFVYTDASFPEAVTIERLDLKVEPSKLDMADLRVRFGQSDLRATGRVDNALAYVFTDAPLKGSLNLSSTLLDLRPWAGDEGETEGGAPAEDSALATVPDNLDLVLDADLKRVLYDRYELNDVRGQMTVRDGAVRLDPLDFETLGGHVQLKGGYVAPTAEKADVDMAVELDDFGLGDTVAFFDTLGRIAPVAKGAGGSFSSAFTLKTTLGADSSPDLATLFSSGRLQTKGVKLSPAFLEKVSSYLGDTRFAGMDLDGSALAFLVEGGRLKLDELPLKVGGVAATLAGTTGLLDQTMDLKLAMTLPTSSIKAADALSKLGVSGAGDVDLLVKVGGTFTDPKVSFDVGKMTEALVEDLKAAAVETVNAALSDAAQKLLDDAKKAGDKLVAEAATRAQQLRDEAGKAGDKLVAEADASADKLLKEAKGNPVKEAAAKEAGKKLRSEAKEKSKKLQKEADKAATKVETEAAAKREALVADAQSRIDAGLVK